ncbi:hypothetical protein C3L33_06821, partial [Rhododendron williamsianum]
MAKPSKSSPLRSFPKTQAQKLIKSFNLSPKHDINNGDVGHVMDESLAGGPMMVEKPLRLPVLGDPAGNNSIQDLGHHAGYYRLPNTVDARMFYFFFESRNNNTDDPVVIWLTGGPGCGSELALFYENGPFHIANNLSLLWNEFGWDQASNLIYVDQPTGTGFSYSSSPNDTRHDENGVSNDLYNFLQGFAIGNGLTDPIIQYPAYPDFALDMNLIQQSDYDNIESELVPPCTQAASLCGAKEEILARMHTKFAIPYSVEYCPSRVILTSTVYDAMITDWMRNLEVGIPALLEDGIKMLAYAGEYDLICNWLGKLLSFASDFPVSSLVGNVFNVWQSSMLAHKQTGEPVGNSNWVHAMAWSGQKDFTAASNVSFVVDGAEKGVMKSYGPLTFLKVHDAGHLVPMDQPKAALEMLRRWTQGSL